MSSTSNRANGDVIRDFLSVADLLEEPQLAQLYAYLTREGEATVGELMEALDLAQGTAYTYVNQLVDTGVLEATADNQPRTRRTTDEDIDTYIDRHGVAGLATALSYAVDRERGGVTHRTMASDLDISPLAAEIILQALRPIVNEYFEIEQSGASVADIQGVDQDTASDDT